MKKRGWMAATLIGVCGVAQAATPDPAAAPATEQVAAPKKKMKMKAKKPMRMDAPMQSPMAKDGMTMGDVKDSAAKKDAAMKDMMQREEKTMPAVPPAPAAR